MSLGNVGDTQRLGGQTWRDAVGKTSRRSQDQLPTEDYKLEKRGVEKLPTWARGIIKAGAAIGYVACSLIALGLLPLSIAGTIMFAVGEKKRYPALMKAGIVLSAPALGAEICYDVMRGKPTKMIERLKSAINHASPKYYQI
jgi:hypothetical protein